MIRIACAAGGQGWLAGCDIAARHDTRPDPSQSAPRGSDGPRRAGHDGTRMGEAATCVTQADRRPML